MVDEAILLTDDPAEHVHRITLNRPAKRNALSNALRAEIFAALGRRPRSGELAQLNKRLVHRQMEAMGLRAGLRAGTDLHALGWHTTASRSYMAKMREGVKAALDARDETFGDYRTGAGKARA
ncbi:MAG: hypothetical protein ACYC8V_08640 [Caulobacteraceae bacterium]